VLAAQAAGLRVQEFVDANAAAFTGLARPLNLSVDDLIRTSSDPRHAAGVERFWQIADEANRYVNHTRPWSLAKVGDRAELAAVLSALLRACQAIGTHLAPFLPDAAARITGQCTPNESGLLPPPAPLLPRLIVPVPASV
jgi:methionyl-tRNA synthetase